MLLAKLKRILGWLFHIVLFDMLINYCTSLGGWFRLSGEDSGQTFNCRILVFGSWQQDVRLENGQGTDAKTMLTLIDVSSQHSQGCLPFWSRLVKHAYSYGIVLGTMILFQTIAKTSNRKLKLFCQRFDMRFRTSNMAPFCKWAGKFPAFTYFGEIS